MAGNPLVKNQLLEISFQKSGTSPQAYVRNTKGKGSQPANCISFSPLGGSELNVFVFSNRSVT
jgi:hypothetical protein